MLVNIAPIGIVTFSSSSKFSTNEDGKEILYSKSINKYSCYSDYEESPWILIELEFDIDLIYIKVINYLNNNVNIRKNTSSLVAEFSTDGIEFKPFDSIEESNDFYEFNIRNNTINRCKFIKLRLREKNNLLLKNIKIFTELNDICYRLKLISSEFKDILISINKLFTNDFPFDVNYFSFNHVSLISRSFYLNIFDYHIYRDNKLYLRININTCKKNLNPELLPFLRCCVDQIDGYIGSDDSADRFFIYKELAANPEQEFYFIYNELHKSLYEFISIAIRKVISKNFIIGNSLNSSSLNSTVIIDSDIISHCGFADRLRGIISIYQICKYLNLDFLIKFTKPFNLDKFYNIRNNINEYPHDLHNLNKLEILPIANLPFHQNYLAKYLLFACHYYDYIILSTNYIFRCNFKQNFNDLFSIKNNLNSEIVRFSNIINGKYISISFRFMNLFGDFDEQSYSEELSLSEKEKLLTKCLYELNKFISTIDVEYKILVLSDSRYFLDKASTINRVFTLPGSIIHTGNIKDTSTDDHSILKTLLDFHMIMNAESIYRFITYPMYSTNFPFIASLCGGKQFYTHKF